MPAANDPYHLALTGATDAGEERRWSPRRAAVEPRAWIAWEDGRSARVGPAVLLDVSRGGAAVVAPAPAPPGARVRLRLEGDAGPLGVAAGRVIAVEALTSQSCEATPGTFVADAAAPSVPALYLVRVAFDGPCPPALFEAASRGLPALRAMLN